MSKPKIQFLIDYSVFKKLKIYLKKELLPKPVFGPPSVAVTAIKHCNQHFEVFKIK